LQRLANRIVAGIEPERGGGHDAATAGEKLQRGADAAALWMLRGYFEKRGCHDAADAAAADLFDVPPGGGGKSELLNC
jgi:hypothetical protein